MSFVWNMQNIRKLAPDGLTMNRAMGVFFANKWQEIGGNEKVIWAKYPYYAGRYFTLIIQLDPLKYRCACGSKTKPCKHILGLLVQLYRNSEAFFITKQVPSWANKLLTDSSSSGPAEKRINPVSTKASIERRKVMESGIQFLEKWLRQLMRHGLAEVKGKAPDYWDNIAAQLVDAKLGGVAKKIRYIKIIIEQEDWVDQLGSLIGELYLYVKAFNQYEGLPNSLSRDIDTYAGISPKRGEVLETKAISDHWLVLGQSFGEEDNLSYRRTWLWGIKSGVPALNLAYSWGGQPYLHSFKVGGIYQADMHFYPSAYPLRAITEQVRMLEENLHHPKNGYLLIDYFLKHFAEAKLLNPFLLHFPVLLHQVALFMEQQQLVLVDTNKHKLDIDCEDDLAWQLLAFGGGGVLTFFGEWSNGQMSPLGLWTGDRSFFVKM